MALNGGVVAVASITTAPASCSYPATQRAHGGAPSDAATSGQLHPAATQRDGGLCLGLHTHTHTVVSIEAGITLNRGLEASA